MWQINLKSIMSNLTCLLQLSICRIKYMSTSLGCFPRLSLSLPILAIQYTQLQVCAVTFEVAQIFLLKPAALFLSNIYQFLPLIFQPLLLICYSEIGLMLQVFLTPLQPIVVLLSTVQFVRSSGAIVIVLLLKYESDPSGVYLQRTFTFPIICKGLHCTRVKSKVLWLVLHCNSPNPADIEVCMS